MLDRPRTVRCAKCANDWMAVPIEDDVVPEPAAPEPAETETFVQEPADYEAASLMAADLGPTPLSAIDVLSSTSDLSFRVRRNGDTSHRIRRTDRIVTAAWAISFAALAGLGVAGYTKRDALMREWPASKRVYATLGLVPADSKSQDGKDTSEPPTH